MRIGIVSQSFFPIRGGVAEHVYYTARELERRGHSVTVITAHFNRFEDNRGLDVIRLGHDLTIPFNKAFVNITISLRLKRLLRAIEAEKKFDLVHVHGATEPVLPLAALASFDCPKVGTFHSFNERPSLGYEVFQKRLQPFFDRLSGRIAVSEAAHSFISRYFPGQYDIVPNGVDIDRFKPDAKPFPWYRPDREFVILFVGRMDPRKGLKYLLQAFSLVADQVPRAKLVVVGNGILKPYYARFAPSGLRSRIEFMGFVSAEDLPRYYASCDVFCAPADGHESFGIVLLEGLAAGRPVVASAIPGYQTVIRHGQDGILVTPKSPLALASAIIDLYRHPQDRVRLSQTGRQRALEFSWPSVAERIEAVYERVLNHLGQGKLG